MLKLQFSLAIAAALLLPSLGLAREIHPSHVDFRQIQSQIASSSAFVTPMPDSKPVLSIARSEDSRHRQRRDRLQRRSTKTISAPARKIFPAGTATIRQSSDETPSTTVIKQQQSVQCSAEGNSTVTQSSTTTVNGRTTSAQTRTNCK